MPPTAEQLFLQDVPCQCDWALVFGSANPTQLAERTVRACELHQAGYAPFLLLSGGGGRSGDAGQSEAHRMGELAESLGVSRERLFLEEDSYTTIENVRNALEVVRGSDALSLGSVSLVSSQWHMYRVLMIVEHLFPSSAEFCCHPTPAGCHAGNWNDQPEYEQWVENELRLIEQLLKAGVKHPRRFRAPEAR